MHCIQALCCCIICAKNMILDLDISLWARAVSEKKRTYMHLMHGCCTLNMQSHPQRFSHLVQILTLPTLTQQHPKGNSKKLDQVSGCFWI